ncbi:hypothetical protein QYE76_029476 [Lolium multiflorum]|uniref:NB-ARC domain-containing protein n=1 Tax=Lolium multiflorum TaxID=4521 RepID=A0AAD8QRH9_LOLMU|nr:hypothetical protein QYE76_029476 [Lolium multiflorum]
MFPLRYQQLHAPAHFLFVATPFSAYDILFWEQIEGIHSSMAESTVSAVVGNIAGLVIEETKFLCAITLQVATLKNDLMRLQGYLKDADSRRRSGNDARAATLVIQIRAAAYEAETVIQAADHMEKRNRLKNGFLGAISRYARLPTDTTTIREIGIEIECVRSKLSEIFASIESLEIVDIGNSNVVEDEPPEELSILQKTIEEDIVMVGFRGDFTEVVEKLVDKENNTLSAVSIVAIGGAGKTTLSRKIYSRMSKHFEIVAWVTASQMFKGIDLLKDILKQIVDDIEEYKLIDQMSEYEVGKKINDFLMQKRYLVVLDDLCEVDTWEQINTTLKIFPDANNGSRVILTTKKKDVADHVEMRNFVHTLKHLDEESWELFSSKALPSYNRPAINYVHAFEEIGRKLARKCNGLPLALAVLGAYLSKNLNLQTWSDIELGWPVSTNETPQMMRDILARSYKGMPNSYFRSCLLSLATFPEDDIIFVSDLIQLWIVESFIPHTPIHTQEETAHIYVTGLAERSLVQVVEISKAHGWIEKIKIHDNVRQWCIEEARQDGQAGAPSSSSDTMLSYRTSFQNTSAQTLQATTANLRSFFGFGLSSVIVDPKLRLLRVIHVQDSSLKNFNKVIGGCTHLTYLKLRNCKDVSIPSSVGQLLYLQSIDLRGTELEKVVPNSLWDIPTLKHVYVSKVTPPARSSLQPTELLTLALNLDSAGTEYPYHAMAAFLAQMARLTSLTLIVNSMPAEMVKIFANMPHLVDLTMYEFHVLDKLPESHHFPQKLRRLCLYARTINEDPLPILQKLPCLVVLVLKGYGGQTMSCSTQGFPELQELELARNFNTKEWRMQFGSMRKLTSLKLGNFSKMKELPKRCCIQTSVTWNSQVPS